MSALVEWRHDAPMTTSLTVAEGVSMSHASVIKLVRNHVKRLENFGEVGFQIRLNPQGSPSEFAWLNEGQSLFLLTLMRNAPAVVEFKLALVQAFLELRDRVAAGAAGALSREVPLTLAHRADNMVSADRIFRSVTLSRTRGSGKAERSRGQRPDPPDRSVPRAGWRGAPRPSHDATRP